MATSKYLTKPFTLSIETINRIFSRITVNHSTNCWIWTGAKDRHGYGYVRFCKDVALTHRLMYAWLIKPLQDTGRRTDVPVLHHAVCDNPSCCNPFHLVLISQKEHMLISKGTVGYVNSRKTHCSNNHLLPPKVPGKPRRCPICYPLTRRLYYLNNRDKIIAKSREWKRLNRNPV